MSALINRDPFARQELHRENVYVNRECAWCGNVRRTTGGRFFLFRYTVETDGGRKYPDKNLFCALDCREAYHG